MPPYRRTLSITGLALAVVAGLALAAPTSADVGDTPSTQSVAVGAQPNAVTFDDSTAWTADFGADQVTPVVAGVAGTPIATGDGPFGLATNPVSAALYVTNYLEGTLSVIDRASGQETSRIDVGNFPSGVAVSPDGSRVYVANLGTDSVTVLDAGDLSTVDIVPVDDEPWGIAVTADGTLIAVTNSATTDPGVLGSVSLIDASTLTAADPIPLGNNPTGIAFSADGSTAYVANTDDATLSVIDVASRAVTATTSLGPGVAPMGVALASNEHAVYVTDMLGGDVLLIDPDTYALLGQSIPVGAQPRSVAVGPDAKTAYVANFGSNSLTTISWARPQRPPGAPTGVTATAAVESAVVTWTAPADPGTSPITSYTVTASPGGQTCTVAAGSALNCRVLGLTAGIPRTFTVIATSAVGSSDPSDPSNSVTPLPQPGPGPGPTPTSPPTPPTGVTAVAGIEAAEVAWTPSVSPGSSALLRYVVTATPSGNQCQAAPSATPSCTVTDLNSGVPVSFTVVAYNATDPSSPSAPSNTVTPLSHPGAPSAPLDVTATASGLTIAASWQAPESDGHSPITGYEAVARTDDGGAWHTCVTTGALTCTITGLQGGETYRVFVTADNAQGTSPPSELTDPITIKQAAVITHVSSTVPTQSYQQVLLSDGFPAAVMTSKTPSTCVAQGQRAVFVAKGSCQLVIKQAGFSQRTVKTNVGGRKSSTATPLTTEVAVSFAKGSSALSDKAKKKLRSATPALRKATTVTVEASAPGANLARQRAEAITSYLTSRGVSVTATTSLSGQGQPNTGTVRTAP